MTAPENKLLDLYVDFPGGTMGQALESINALRPSLAVFQDQWIVPQLLEYACLRLEKFLLQSAGFLPPRPRSAETDKMSLASVAINDHLNSTYMDEKPEWSLHLFPCADGIGGKVSLPNQAAHDFFLANTVFVANTAAPPDLPGFCAVLRLNGVDRLPTPEKLPGIVGIDTLFPSVEARADRALKLFDEVTTPEAPQNAEAQKQWLMAHLLPSVSLNDLMADITTAEARVSHHMLNVDVSQAIAAPRPFRL